MNRRAFVQTLGAGAVGLAVARESAAEPRRRRASAPVR